MQVGKILLLASVLLISCTAGCTFLSHTKFTMLSLAIDDESGFPQLLMMFNTSDTIALSLRGPQQATLFSDTYFYGIHHENISLAGYRTAPPPGRYTIVASDSSKNTIYTNELQYNGSDLSVVSVSEEWWAEKQSYSLIGVALSVKNTGDVPAYPYTLIIRRGTAASEVLVPPMVVLPYTNAVIRCCVHLTDFIAEETSLNFTVLGKNGDILAQTRRVVSPTTPIPSYAYEWHYLRDNSLTIPMIEWFYSYYKSLPRFDITDYAAYVFDPYDDVYLSLVANRILSLPSAPAGESERADFIASFVQSLDYVKDDPLNESYEYPRYPLETLREHHGDCEDKAILTAALLDSLGYNVSLLRLPNHMAVGVHLSNPLAAFSYYVNQYYFLETTTLFSPLGKVPSEYQGLTNITVYPVSFRPLLLHNWDNATRFRVSTGQDYVVVKMIVENLGPSEASNVEIRGAFYDDSSMMYNQETTTIPTLAPYEKQMITLTINVPALVETMLKTQLYLGGVMVHQRESVMRFS